MEEALDLSSGRLLDDDDDDDDDIYIYIIHLDFHFVSAFIKLRQLASSCLSAVCLPLRPSVSLSLHMEKLGPQ